MTFSKENLDYWNWCIKKCKLTSSTIMSNYIYQRKEKISRSDIFYEFQVFLNYQINRFTQDKAACEYL